MTDKGNKKKADQLGMSAGKAAHILRKKILFDLLQQQEKNICFRCNKKIRIIDDLSVEHKKPWLDSDDPIGLFFDLNNIAFSHLRCNLKFSRNTTKIEYPEGQKWCWNCKKFKDLSNFPPSAKHNRNKACTKCESALRQEYRMRTGKR